MQPPSALLLKLVFTLWTCDADFSLSSWNTDFLFAGRAAVNVIYLPLLTLSLCQSKTGQHSFLRTEILLILSIPLRIIFGKHTEVADSEKQDRQQIHSCKSGKHVHNQARKTQAKDKSGEFIRTVPAVHKANQTFFHKYYTLSFSNKI